MDQIEKFSISNWVKLRLDTLGLLKMGKTAKIPISNFAKLKFGNFCFLKNGQD